MAFERLRQEKEAEEIRGHQRKKAAAEAARIAQLQKEQADRLAAQAQQQQQVAFQAERERIKAERQKALAFREKSGVVKKLEEFTALVKGVTLIPNKGEGHKDPSNVVDILEWDKRLVETIRLPDYKEHGPFKGYYIIHPIKKIFEEKYLVVETSPDGKIVVRGHEGFTFLGIGYKGTISTLEESDWTNKGVPRPVVFEAPIWAAYNNPMTTRYINLEHTSRYIDLDSATGE